VKILKDKINYFDYKILHKVEEDLNKVNYKGLQLGILLSSYFNVFYSSRINKSWIKKAILFLVFFFKPFSKEKLLNDQNKSLIFFSSGSFSHLKSIQNAVTPTIKEKKNTIIIRNDASEGIDKKIFFLTGIFDFLKVLLFLLKNLKSVNEKIKLLNLSITLKIQFFLELHFQILKALSLLKFVKSQSNTKVIGADYDRGYESALFFSVAKALNIESFHVQHGSFNPPVGYFPVNADKICVWGEMSKNQLIQLGTMPKKILVTGTPIVQDIEINEKIRKNYIKMHGLNSGKNIVLALSSPDKFRDEKQVEFLSKIKKLDRDMENNFLVKIHPARNFKDYLWIKRKFDIDLLPIDITKTDFMNIVDILLTHNSGLANEAIFHDKKVGIIDVLDIAPRNGIELKKYLNVPIIKSSSTLEDIFDICPVISKDKLFHKIGLEAEIEIKRKIWNY